MKRESISNAVGNICSCYVEEAADIKIKSKKNAWLKLASAAACICAIAAVAIFMSPKGDSGKKILTWCSDFEPSDYFKYCTNTGAFTEELSDVDVKERPMRSFSKQREAMEEADIILSMPDHSIFSCVARYNDDKSIYSVKILWQIRGDTYSDLSVTASKSEPEYIKDTVYIETDGHGNILPPTVTVTQRDGTDIIATGKEDQEKTLTFKRGNTHYLIVGSHADSYISMAKLLDWFWEHPIDLELFAFENGFDIE